MAKILMITGDFTEDYETMVPFQTLLACSHEVDAVCWEVRPNSVVSYLMYEFSEAAVRNLTWPRRHHSQ